MTTKEIQDIKDSMKKDVDDHLEFLKECAYQVIDSCNTEDEVVELTDNHDPSTLVHAVSEMTLEGCESCSECETSCDVEEKKKYDN